MGARTTNALAAVAALATVIGIAGAPVAGAAPETETLTVDAASATGTTTATALVAGTSYTITASGTYAWGLAGGKADAECSAIPPDNAWQSNRFAAVYGPPDDNLDLYVNGAAVAWQPASRDAADAGCDAAGHTYRIVYTPATTGPARFAVVDKMNSSRSGSLTVTVATPPSAASASGAAPTAPAPPAATSRTTRPPRVLGAAATNPAPAPAPAAAAAPPRRPTTTRPPSFASSPFAVHYGAIKAPTLPKQPFHMTVLGWLTLVTATVLALASTAFIFATRSDNVDTGLRAAMASVLRVVVGGRPAAEGEITEAS